MPPLSRWSCLLARHVGVDQLRAAVSVRIPNNLADQLASTFCPLYSRKQCTRVKLARADEGRRVGALVSGIGVAEELADVRLAQGSQDRVGDRVVDGVAVGMPHRPVRVLEPDAREDERAAPPLRGDRFETMQVVAVADSHGG